MNFSLGGVEQRGRRRGRWCVVASRSRSSPERINNLPQDLSPSSTFKVRLSGGLVCIAIVVFPPFLADGAVFVHQVLGTLGLLEVWMFIFYVNGAFRDFTYFEQVSRQRKPQD